jgi:SAM-dependent methyltransferase
LVDKRDFDLVFSHMFLEHVQTPLQVHRNIHSLLKPGGLAIHFYPSPCNVPLGLNRVLPEWITTTMVRIAQPTRDLDGQLGKFPAYYKMCGNPSEALHRIFESMGYKVLAHTGFVGHTYYDRFPIVRDIELSLRPLLVRFGLGMTSAQLLILQKL